MTDFQMEQLFKEAQDPKITTQRLDEMLDQNGGNRYLVKEILKNPGISLQTFIRWVIEFPEIIPTHPTLPLFDLENPGWYFKPPLSDYPEFLLDDNFDFWAPRLIKSENALHRNLIAVNKRATPEILEILSKDCAHLVRVLVASHKNTSVETLKCLAKDEYIMIRQAVGANHNTDLETLTILSKDPRKEIKGAVANNPTYIQKKWDSHLASVRGEA